MGETEREGGKERWIEAMSDRDEGVKKRERRKG